MTIRRLAEDLAKPAPRFSVIGKYVPGPGATFVQHVALLRDETPCGPHDVAVLHMGPPIVAGPISAAVRCIPPLQLTCPAHLVGIVELDADDIEGIETWLADVDKEDRPWFYHQYVVNPPMRWATAENTTRQFRQFSCVGFVLEGYRSVGINLIDDSDPSRLPEVDLDTLVQAYGKHVRRDELRELFGIPGPGPWKILLAGYMFHAVDCDPPVVRWPHVPTSIAERLFPLPSTPPTQTPSAAPPASPPSP